jgi:hypothetical protein
VSLEISRGSRGVMIRTRSIRGSLISAPPLNAADHPAPVNKIPSPMFSQAVCRRPGTVVRIGGCAMCSSSVSPRARSSLVLAVTLGTDLRWLRVGRHGRRVNRLKQTGVTL